MLVHRSGTHNLYSQFISQSKTAAQVWLQEEGGWNPTWRWPESCWSRAQITTPVQQNTVRFSSSVSCSFPSSPHPLSPKAPPTQFFFFPQGGPLSSSNCPLDTHTRVIPQILHQRGQRPAFVGMALSGEVGGGNSAGIARTFPAGWLKGKTGKAHKLQSFVQ